MIIEEYTLNDSTIRIPIPERYKDCLTLIKSDRYRHSGKKESSLSVIVKNLMPFGHSLLFWLRLSQYKGWLYPLSKFVYTIVSRKHQVQISTSTKIGFGFSMGHGICMVINGGTIIGNNVGISQFVNIGSNHKTPAIIGDNVYIGPHVCVVEDVKIGSNSTIGAGSVVVRDIPENATAAGVPARVLNYNNPGRFINRRWPVAL